MHYLSYTLTRLVSNFIPLKEQEIRIFQYCFEQVLNKLLYSIIFLGIGWFTHRLLLTVVFLFAFTMLRRFGGGAHASNPIICFILSYEIGLLFIFGLPMVYSFIPEMIYILIFILSSIPILLLSPMDTKNKRIKGSLRRKLQVRSRILILLLLLVFFVLFVCRLKLYYGAITFCVMICSVNILIGLIQNKRK